MELSNVLFKPKEHGLDENFILTKYTKLKG
jgi:hypothetical protein